MSDSLLKLHRDKMCRKKRVGDWKNENLKPLLDDYNIDFINLEIGCGHGHWLSTFAKENPDEVFVGVDLISKRIQKAESKVIKQQIKNWSEKEIKEKIYQISNLEILNKKNTSSINLVSDLISNY